MFSDELKELLIKVLTSWQVIAATLVIIIYVALVNYVSRSRYRRRTPPPPPVKAAKTEKAKEKPEPEEDDENELDFEEE